MEVKSYSKKLNGHDHISEHFAVEEFACHDGSDTVLIDGDLPPLLEKIREYYRQKTGKACTIVLNSGYRTPSYNKRIGGATHSQHCLGKAADFTVRIPNGGIVSPATVYNDIDSGRIFGAHNGGLGRYKNFTHIDVRDGKSRWNG